MLTNERHRQIVETLASKYSASVAELSKLFDVSPVTIRYDLNQLAKHGHVIRMHGGAQISKERVRQEYTFATRQNVNADKKKNIAELATTLIEPRDSILLDSSSTAVAVANAIKRSNDVSDLTIVTTGIWTALELLGSPDINVVLAGGYVRNTTGSITGSITNEILNKFNFQKAFLGAYGVSDSKGFTDLQLLEVELKRAIIQRTQEVIIIADSSKFGQLGLANFAELSNVSTIITDNSAPAKMVNSFKQKGVDVMIAPDSNKDSKK